MDWLMNTKWNTRKGFVAAAGIAALAGVLGTVAAANAPYVMGITVAFIVVQGAVDAVKEWRKEAD